MLIPSGEGEGMVNSQLVTQGNFNSPSHGLAVVVKKRIPTTRGSASRGRNLFFTTPAKPWLGELKLPFVTRWEFIIPSTRGFATQGEESHPKIQQTKMLVTCQRFGDWFLFGLVWPYSSNQKNIMKVGSKSLLLTCSSNKLWAYLYYIFLIRRES